MVDFNKFRWTPERNHSIPFERPTEAEQHKDSVNDAPPWESETENDWTDNVELTANYVKEQIRLMTETVRKANRQPDMLNRSRGNNARGSKKKNGLGWLELSHVSTDKKRVQILWAGDPKEADAPDWGVVTVKIQFQESKLKVLWTLGDTNPCLDLLENELGSEEKDWVGRELFLWKETVGVGEKEYIRVEVAASESAQHESSSRKR